MKKFIFVSALALGLGASGVACSSPWWQQITTNPADAVQSFETTAELAINAAQVTWATIMPFLPAATAAAINTQFLNAISSVNHALQILNDAVQAAIAAKQPNPDFTALMQAVSDAIGQVVAIVQTYIATPAPDAGAASVSATPKLQPSAVPGYADLINSYNSLKHYTAK